MPLLTIIGKSCMFVEKSLPCELFFFLSILYVTFFPWCSIADDNWKKLKVSLSVFANDKRERKKENGVGKK